MDKKPYVVIITVGILATLANNYIFYNDIIFNKHGGLIQQGIYANVAVVLLVSVIIGCFVFLGVSMAAGKLVPYIFNPEVVKNRRLGTIQAQLEDIQDQFESMETETKEFGQFVEYAKKEIGKLN